MNEERPSLEERMSRIEGILEENRTRLNHLETEINQLRQEMNANNREIRQEMRTQFRWTLGIMLGVLIPMWVSIILAILL